MTPAMVSSAQKAMRMRQRSIYPKNKKHFKRLLLLAKQILSILKKNKIGFVIYSSYATFFYTKDENLAVHDIDVLIANKDFPKLMEILDRNKIKFKFLPKWDTLEIKKGKLKVDIDRMGKGCPNIKEGGLPKRTIKADFYGISVKLVTPQDLYNTYFRGYNLSKEDKTKLGKKVKYLRKFLYKALK